MPRKFRATYVPVPGLATIGDVAAETARAEAAEATKAAIASPTFTGTVSGVTKAMVGLGSADNTPDSGKPVSTAQAAADAAVGAAAAADATTKASAAQAAAIAASQPVDSDLTAIAGLTPSNDDFIQRKSGIWVNRSVAQVKTDLGYAALATSGSADDLADGTTKKAFLATERTRLAALPDLDANGHFASTVMRQPEQQRIALRRTGALAETFSRTEGVASSAALLASKLNLFGIYLLKGTVVSNITFLTGASNGSGLTHTWFGLWDSSLVQRGLTADDTSATWNAAVEKTLALTAAYTIPADGLYYLGVVVTGTTPPTLAAHVTNTGAGLLAPFISGGGTAASYATGPGSAPNPAPTPTVGINAYAYAYVT